MFQVRIHGRGGQGVVSAAEMLSVAAFLQGKHALAFPSFGSERMGAPVMSFCRIDNNPIRSREPVMQPDALIIQDPTLLHGTDLFQGLSPEGYVLINSPHELEALRLEGNARCLSPGHGRTVPASSIALRHVGRAAPNAALLGAFVALSGILDLDSVLAAIRERFSGAVGEKNVLAAKEAFAFLSQSPERHIEVA